MPALVWYLAVISILAVIGWWFTGQLPAPMQNIGRIIVAALVTIALLAIFWPTLSNPPSIRFH